MATPSHFLINKNQFFKIKKSSSPSSGKRIEIDEWKCGVHKMATPLGIFRGSSLNLEWSKRGIRLDDQWMPISWLHIEDIWCMLGFYIHLRLWHVDRVDWFVLIKDSDAMIFSVFHWYIRLRHWHVGSLMIDLIALLSTLTLILSWLFWSLHMHTLTTVYHSAWHVDSLTCILFWSSLSMMFVSPFVLIVVFSLILCVHDDISELCLIVCRMTALLLHDCVPFVYVGRISISLSPTL